MNLLVDRIRFKFWKTFGLMRFIPDDKYLRVMFHVMMKQELNLDCPKTFNQKLQWLKLHDRKIIYTEMVDKYQAKKYVATVIGKEHVIPTFGVWDRFQDIDFSDLPSRFVLKCTHDSGGLVICNTKEKYEIKSAKVKIEKCLRHDYFLNGREWPYKMVKPRIIAEQYMEDSDKPGELTDYKIHCFNGEPKLIQVITDRFSENGMINDHYTLDWEKLDLVRGDNASSNKSIHRPPEMDEMLGLAKKLCRDTYYVRIDFYIIEKHVYFGEITFYPASGFTPFHPDKWDQIWGDWLKLPID